jgi:hypothetical protein
MINTSNARTSRNPSRTRERSLTQRKKYVLYTLSSVTYFELFDWFRSKTVTFWVVQGSHVSWKTWKITNLFSRPGNILEFWKSPGKKLPEKKFT